MDCCFSLALQTLTHRWTKQNRKSNTHANTFTHSQTKAHNGISKKLMHWNVGMGNIYVWVCVWHVQWYHAVSLLAVPMCSICLDTMWPHVNCTFAVHRSYCNCVVERIELHLHCRLTAFAVIVSMSSSYPNWLIVQMSNERLNFDEQLNNRYKWIHHTSPTTKLDSLHCNQNMSVAKVWLIQINRKKGKKWRENVSIFVIIFFFSLSFWFV